MTEGDAWDPKPETLPGILRDVARIGGLGVALALAERWGGSSHWIPKDCDARHDLARAIGLRPARAVCQALGGEEYKIPSLKYLRVGRGARKMRAAGHSLRAIAIKLGISEDWARRITKGVEKGASAREPADLDQATHCPACGRRNRIQRPAFDDRQLTFMLEEIDGPAP